MRVQNLEIDMLHWFESIIVKHVYLLLVIKNIFLNAVLNVLFFVLLSIPIITAITYCRY